jgi:hypothetical protein
MSENPSSNPNRCASGREGRGLRMAGLIALLVYQGILVLLTFYFVVSCVRTEGDLPFRDYWFANELYVLVPACWGMALSYASIGMIMRIPGHFS